MRAGWFWLQAFVLLALSGSITEAKSSRWVEVHRTRYGTKTLVDVANIKIANNGVLKVVDIKEDASIDPTVSHMYLFSRVKLDFGLGLINIEPRLMIFRGGAEKLHLHMRSILALFAHPSK